MFGVPESCGTPEDLEGYLDVVPSERLLSPKGDERVDGCNSRMITLAWPHVNFNKNKCHQGNHVLLAQSHQLAASSTHFTTTFAVFSRSFIPNPNHQSFLSFFPTALKLSLSFWGILEAHSGPGGVLAAAWQPSGRS